MNKKVNLIESKRLYIKKLEFEDALHFKDWSLFDNPYLFGYNYGNFSELETRIWFNSIKTIRKKYYAVYEKKEDKFVGFLGLKNIKVFQKSARLGIVFDPGNVEKGYGYEAMMRFLDYFFNDLDFNTMELFVNSFNKRALNLYKKLGFIKISEFLEVFENQFINADDINFFKKNGQVYSKLYKMKLEKERYIESKITKNDA
ncbi:MAG: GNAT family N-acetyltransferase [Tissierellia bacterium]|nr:GNAT family N-acetyltransferase [Tissierellia bacterium]